MAPPSNESTQAPSYIAPIQGSSAPITHVSETEQQPGGVDAAVNITFMHGNIARPEDSVATAEQFELVIGAHVSASADAPGNTGKLVADELTSAR